MGLCIDFIDPQIVLPHDHTLQHTQLLNRYFARNNYTVNQILPLLLLSLLLLTVTFAQLTLLTRYCYFVICCSIFFYISTNFKRNIFTSSVEVK